MNDRISQQVVEAYKLGLSRFYDVLMNMDESSCSANDFFIILDMGINKFGISTTQMSKENGMGKNTIHYWLNKVKSPREGHKIMIIQWMREKLRIELNNY